MNEIENQSQMNSSNSQVESSTQTDAAAPTIGNGEPLFSESVNSVIDSLKNEWVKIHLESTLTLAQLVDLQEQLSQYQGGKVQLFGAKVGWVDTAALQLFLAFKNTPNTVVEWIEPSSELCSAARMIGLSSHLNLPV